ncbi:hypothetical protein CJ030_MR1G016844 [Morella rubra]|uniref:Endonuclease/exonuclease/phosphatase domain-containing protein n=1 Tax=Morella rubra TaxID=262757 RepID=A0A6A1WU45_9ROSI|nr:hypothetical protein CJ030_MR1G016844 [Morella rubra]
MEAFWRDLALEAANFKGPWLCTGDFNSIVSYEDKQGGRDFASSSVGDLRLFMNQNGLIDLGLMGLPYTWTNCHHGVANIREKLDRGIGNIECRGLFPRAAVTNLPITLSDHSPLLLDTYGGSSALPSTFRKCPNGGCYGFKCLVEENLCRALGEEHIKEESLWRSKSRVQWLTSPNLNTRFFQVSTIVRRSRNAMEFIKNPDGQWLESRAQVSQLFVNSFSELFSTTNPKIPFDLEVLISLSITTKENVELCCIPSEGEVWVVVRQIDSRTALGPSGLTALLYKQYWLL